MNQKNLKSRVYSLVKAAVAAAALPVFFVYIMIAKPDYRIMNGAAHIVVPVAHAVGDVLTWPVRVGGNIVHNIHDLAVLRRENAELRAELDAMRARSDECDAAILDNQRLAMQADIIKTHPDTVAANVVHDAAALHHNNYFIDRGAHSGIEPGMAVTTFDGRLVGIVIDAAPSFARVRALTDADTNIAVRILGSEVYGFMRGHGTSHPTMGFFSDPEFQPTPGIKLVTSSIGGVLPDGIMVGETENESDVRIKSPGEIMRVMVWKFNGDGTYGVADAND